MNFWPFNELLALQLTMVTIYMCGKKACCEVS